MMDFFDLQKRTLVGRVIPKNAFDAYTNTKQKKLFTDCIKRITWTHKLSPETVNLNGKDIKEIQVFKVELKKRSDISKVLEIVNKAIPYHLVFWTEFEDDAFISTASKHPHPTNGDIAVIDWVFSSDWFKKDQNFYKFNLKGNLDSTFKDLCVQLTGKSELADKPMEDILQNQQEIGRLKKEISKLKSAISKSKQFNQKVELNLELKKAEQELDKLLSA